MINLEYFNNLVERLKKEGYTITLENNEHKKEQYIFARITGKSIYGGFCNKINSDEIYTYLNGKIAIDHEDCFDKWSKCPLNLEIPTNEEQMQYLLKQLEFWGSEEGYDLSNIYEFDRWISSYPEELKGDS